MAAEVVEGRRRAVAVAVAAAAPPEAVGVAGIVKADGRRCLTRRYGAKLSRLEVGSPCHFPTPYFFRTTHVKQRGREQTYFLSPLKSALGLAILFTNHTDFNVAPIDQLFVVWSAVNRVLREGEVNRR